ncbi:IOVO protein, partial [Centropus bengalensis]|nr:IOVO protein [Centropus bengalensis]
QASCNTYLLSGKMHDACPRIYEPVCGTNSVTYPNECFLCKEIFRNRAIDKKHDGRCVKLDCTGYLRSTDGDVTCTLEYQPFCGTNGVTYRNKCHFCRTVANGLDVNLHNVGECFQQIDCSEQEGNKLLCNAIYNPLCGSDGKTYMNKCQFCRAVEQGSSVPQTSWGMLSAGAIPFVLIFPAPTLQFNTLFPAPLTVSHWSLL